MILTEFGHCSLIWLVSQDLLLTRVIDLACKPISSFIIRDKTGSHTVLESSDDREKSYVCLSSGVLLLLRKSTFSITMRKTPKNGVLYSNFIFNKLISY